MGSARSAWPARPFVERRVPTTYHGILAAQGRTRFARSRSSGRLGTCRAVISLSTCAIPLGSYSCSCPA